MTRSIHIVVSLVAVVLLARPFDCFATGTSSQEAMECCLKGKCGSTAKADTCCKNSVPGDQLVTSKAADYSTPVDVFITSSASTLVRALAVQAAFDLLRHP